MATIFMKILLSALLNIAVLGLMVDPVQAYAYGNGVCNVEFSQNEELHDSIPIYKKWTGVYQSGYNPRMVKAASALNSGIAYVNNNFGAVIMKVPEKLIAGKTDYESMIAAPVVVAFYDPQTAVGTIYLDRAIQIRSSLLVEQIPISPRDGVLFSSYYEGNNPWWQFEQGNNGNPTVSNPNAFVKAGMNGFYAAVGMVVRHFNAQRGLIAAMDLTHQQSTSTSGGFFSNKTTTTVKYDAHPVWTLVLPSGTAPDGYTIGYSLPICSPADGQPMTAGSQSAAISNAKLWATGQTDGGATAQLVNDTWWSALSVMPGVEYISQGTDPSGLNTSQWQVYSYSQSQSGFSFAGLTVIAVLIGALTLGVGSVALSGLASTGALGGASTAVASALTTVGAGSFAGGAVLGAAAAGAASLMYATGGLGLAPKPNISGTYTVKRGQWGSYAGNGNNVSNNTQITSYNLNSYLQSLYGSVTTPGTAASTSATNNPNQFGGSNGVTGALTQQVTPTWSQSGPASLGAQANAALTNAGSTSGGSPLSTTSKLAGVGAPSYQGGSLPPPP